MSQKRLSGWRAAVWPVLFFAMGVLVTLACNRLLLAYLNRAATQGVNHAAGPGEISALEKSTGTKGPWGVLEFEQIPLENFDGMFPDGSGRLKAPRWVFEKQTVAQIKELLKSCHFTPAQKIFVMDTNRWESLPQGGFAISPPDSLVQALSRDTRQALYPVLAQNPENFTQALCYRFPLDSFAARFAGSGLSHERIEMLRAQTYTEEGTLCLCVDRPLQGQLTPVEFDAMLRALFTVRTWRVSVKVNPESDLDAITKYWGRGGRERVIRPLLESLARNGGSGSLNISYFLPPFARMRLYTFPDAYPDAEAMQEDCFYTALNFFTREPDQRLVDNRTTSQAIQSKYAKTDDQWQFGDLVLFKDARGLAVHICVFLADDFVYTKNGTGPAKPWVIMKMQDMMADYQNAQPLQMVHLRQKDS